MKKKQSRLKKFFKLLAILFAFFSFIGITFSYYFFVQLSSELPDITFLRNIQYQTPLNIYSREGALLAQFGDKKRTPVAINEVPQRFINAFLAAEDSRYYQHNGVDYKGILRASLQLLLSGKKKQGGSTITMQVTRNFLLTREKTYTRKIKEIILALQIEKEFTKDEILELYLNKIYLGHHAYGIVAAAQIYYGKSLAELSLAEQAMIAGLPKAPSLYNPITNPERSLERRDYILRRMLDLNYITQEKYDISVTEPITASVHTPQIEFSSPYIAEMVRNKIVELFGEEKAYNSGIKVFTTISKNLQIAANQAMNFALHAYDERHGLRNFPLPNINSDAKFEDIPDIGDTKPAVVLKLTGNTVTAQLKDHSLIQLSWENIQWARKYINQDRIGPSLKSASDILKTGDIIRVRQLENRQWRLSQVPDVEGAFLSLDPKNGAILALKGGFDFKQSKYNRVTLSNRQPGSGFKPIIYTTALEAGYTAASVINDAPVVVDDNSQESEWRPENYSRKFFGPTRLRTALRKSRNLISIRLLRALGIQKVSETAFRFGFKQDQLPKSLTLALGSGQATPLQMARVYAVFANNGFLVKPFFIDRIESNTGEILFQETPDLACSKCIEDQPLKPGFAPRIILPDVSYIMNSLLRDVVQRGTASDAKKLGRKDLAGKTGTTNEQRDAWFNGFTPFNVATAWVGFDKSKPLGAKETGGKAALPMWIHFMEKAIKGIPEVAVLKPENIVEAYIDTETGLLAQPENSSAIKEIFRSEYVPTEFARPTIEDNNNLEGNTVEELF